MKTAVGGRRFCLCLFFFIAGAVFFLAGICLLVLFLPCGLRSLFLFRLRSLLQLHRFRSIFAKLRLSLTGSPGTAGEHFRLCFRLLKNDRFRCCRFLNRSSAILPAAFSRRGSGLCRFGCRFIIFCVFTGGLAAPFGRFGRFFLAGKDSDQLSLAQFVEIGDLSGTAHCSELCQAFFSQFFREHLSSILVYCINMRYL